MKNFRIQLQLLVDTEDGHHDHLTLDHVIEASNAVDAIYKASKMTTIEVQECHKELAEDGDIDYVEDGECEHLYVFDELDKMTHLVNMTKETIKDINSHIQSNMDYKDIVESIMEELEDHHCSVPLNQNLLQIPLNLKYIILLL